jgi:ribonuclease D
MQIHPLITDSDSLKSLCERLSKSDFVAVDTEFMRENSFWPELCLIQIGNTEEAAAIDPKAEGMDMQPLLDLMVDNEEVLKVFHAGGQDIEIIYNLTGKTPHPLFDTQIAAMALGLGEQVGYSNLVESLVGKTLDKGARFTDWARRPLDKRQIDYAPPSSPRCSSGCGGPAAAPGSTRRWSGSRIPPITRTIRTRRGSGCASRAASRRCSGG